MLLTTLNIEAQGHHHLLSSQVCRLTIRARLSWVGILPTGELCGLLRGGSSPPRVVSHAPAAQDVLTLKPAAHTVTSTARGWPKKVSRKPRSKERVGSLHLLIEGATRSHCKGAWIRGGGDSDHFCKQSLSIGALGWYGFCGAGVVVGRPLE